MRVFSWSTLREYAMDHADAEYPLRTWYASAVRADWKTPADIKAAYPTASIIGDNRVVFNIKGNDYRLVVQVLYAYSRIYILFVGTHSEYDKIDAETV